MSVRVTPHKKRKKVDGKMVTVAIPGKVEVDIRVRLAEGGKLRDRHVLAMSRSSAERWGAKHLLKVIELGECPGEGEEGEALTLNAFWPDYVTKHVIGNNLKPTTVQAKHKIWRNYLGPLLGKMKLAEIDTEVVQGFKAKMLDELELSAKTTNNALSDLSSLLQAAMNWNKGVVRMPLIEQLAIEKAGEPEFYEPPRLEQLVEAARRVGPDSELVVLLGAEASLRAGEMVALEWGDIDFDRRTVVLRRGETIPGEVTSTKSNRERRVPLTTRLLEALKVYRHLRGERVFYQNGGTHIALWWTRDRLEAAQKLAGFEKTTGGCHILRHTFCSILAMRGVPALSIQALAGHKELKTTMRYMHLAPGGSPLVEAIAALEPSRHVSRQETKGKGPVSGALS